MHLLPKEAESAPKPTQGGLHLRREKKEKSFKRTGTGKNSVAKKPRTRARTQPSEASEPAVPALPPAPQIDVAPAPPAVQQLSTLPPAEPDDTVMYYCSTPARFRPVESENGDAAVLEQDSRFKSARSFRLNRWAAQTTKVVVSPDDEQVTAVRTEDTSPEGVESLTSQNGRDGPEEYESFRDGNEPPVSSAAVASMLRAMVVRWVEQKRVNYMLRHAAQWHIERKARALGENAEALEYGCHYARG